MAFTVCFQAEATWRCLESGPLVPAWGGCYWRIAGGSKDANQHPPAPGTAPAPKQRPGTSGPGTSSAAVKKLVLCCAFGGFLWFVRF